MFPTDVDPHCMPAAAVRCKAGKPLPGSCWPKGRRLVPRECCSLRRARASKLTLRSIQVINMKAAVSLWA
jgi:hypothetical protein